MLVYLTKYAKKKKKCMDFTKKPMNYAEIYTYN